MPDGIPAGIIGILEAGACGGKYPVGTEKIHALLLIYFGKIPKCLDNKIILFRDIKSLLEFYFVYTRQHSGKPSNI